MYSTTNYTNSLLDSCDFSDAESVVDSLIDSFGNSPAPSIDSWCEQTLHEIDGDIDLEDLLSNTVDMSCHYQYKNNSPLNLPTLNYTNQQRQTVNMMSSNIYQQPIGLQLQQQQQNPLHQLSQQQPLQQQLLQQQPLQQQLQQRQQLQQTKDQSFQLQMQQRPQLPQQQQFQQQLQQHQQLQQREQQNIFQNSNNVFNTFLDVDPRYIGNCSPPRPSPDGHVMELDNNVTAFEEIFQKQLEMLNARSSLVNTNNDDNGANDVFKLNRSTMDNRSQILFLDLIKQQQQQLDLLSNHSSPPPTPCSDWADIPSPCSPIRHQQLIKSEYSDKKDLTAGLLEKQNNDNSDGNLDDELKFPSSDIKINDIKKELKASKPKRKRTNRKQYTPNSDKPRLYKFLRQILEDPETYRCIEWVDKSIGTFKFLDSSEVARLWGLRKNKPSMKYENFARSLRTYIAKGILKKPRNKLVYCFAQPNE